MRKRKKDRGGRSGERYSSGDEECWREKGELEAEGDMRI
jgi:hypothetical protein